MEHISLNYTLYLNLFVFLLLRRTKRIEDDSTDNCVLITKKDLVVKPYNDILGSFLLDTHIYDNVNEELLVKY